MDTKAFKEDNKDNLNELINLKLLIKDTRGKYQPPVSLQERKFKSKENTLKDILNNLSSDQLSFYSNLIKKYPFLKQYKFQEVILLYRKGVNFDDLLCDCNKIGIKCHNVKSLTKNNTNLLKTCKIHSKDKEIKKKIQELTFMKNYGVKNPMQNKEVQQKAIDTNLKKYGTINPMQSKEIKNKNKETFMEKYGVSSVGESSEFQKKAKESIKNKYGTEHYTQSKDYLSKKDIFQEKRKNTIIEKYGTLNLYSIPEIRQKTINTLQKKYGVQWFTQSEYFKEKYKETMLDKYGTEHYFQSPEYQERLPEFLEKTKEKNLEKYGVEWYSQSDDFKEKNLEKYGVEYYSQSQEYKERLPEIQKKQQQTLRKRYGVQWTEDKSKIPMSLYNPEKYFKNINFILSINQAKSYSQYHMENLHLLTKEFIEDKFLNKDNNFMIQDFCNFFNCKETIAYIYLKKFGVEYNKYQGTSSPEYQIIDFIKNDLSVDKDKIIHGDRKTIVPLEIDILIKDHNLAIEYNGLYWHSYSPFNNLSDKQSDLNYQRSRHLNKTIACENKGINLLHIFENEWLDPKKQDIWKSVIGYKLGITKEKHYARKLKVQKIESKEAKAFFEENHLQGGQAPGSIAYGLFKDNELISCMTFGKSRFNKRYDYELIRFASKKYTSCVGCAKRLFKAFVKEYNPTSIISYANRRWASSLSNLYKAIGFKELEAANPNYFYFKINQKEITLKSRNVFQKHKLKDHPDTKDFYDKNKTESQIMSEAGFRRIYDAGNLVYLWKRD